MKTKKEILEIISGLEAEFYDMLANDWVFDQPQEIERLYHVIETLKWVCGSKKKIKVDASISQPQIKFTIHPLVLRELQCKGRNKKLKTTKIEQS